MYEYVFINKRFHNRNIEWESEREERKKEERKKSFHFSEKEEEKSLHNTLLEESRGREFKYLPHNIIKRELFFAEKKNKNRRRSEGTERETSKGIYEKIILHYVMRKEWSEYEIE